VSTDSVQPSLLSPAERRLGWFMLSSGLLFLALLLAEVALLALLVWNREHWELPSSAFSLGAGLLAAAACCALLAGADPRRNRPFVLPVLAAETGCALLASCQLLLMPGGVLRPFTEQETFTRGALVATPPFDLPLLALCAPLALATFLLLRAAVRSVNGSWLRAGPPLE